MLVTPTSHNKSEEAESRMLIQACYAWQVCAVELPEMPFMTRVHWNLMYKQPTIGSATVLTTISCAPSNNVLFLANMHICGANFPVHYAQPLGNMQWQGAAAC